MAIVIQIATGPETSCIPGINIGLESCIGGPVAVSVA
jgi:hypothetical protein